MARILLIDDEETVLKTMRLLIKSAGHDVVPISDGREALRLIQSDEPFDLMLTDIRMSPVDGMEVLKLARRLRPAMAIVVVSAYCSDKVVEEAMSLGCHAYIKKPFRIDEVMGAVAGALGGTTAAEPEARAPSAG